MIKVFKLAILLIFFLNNYSYSQEKIVFIEVQTGTYFGEDDIVRIEDDYNRT